jgi:hypothetical protein
MSDINTDKSSHRSSCSTRSKKRAIQRELHEKENRFVLDCLNSEKTKLKKYNSISDQFLNYFVIRVHPNCKKTTKVPHPPPKIENI